MAKRINTARDVTLSDEMRTKLDEFVPAIEALEAAQADYESNRDPYVTAKQAYNAAIDVVAALAKDIGEAFKDYQVPEKPEPL